MTQIIENDIQKCVGCNRCVRECPSEMANFTYQDETGDLRVRTENEHCIACGACINVCTHGARFYKDDTERFFADLASGKKLSVITAPALKLNFPGWKNLLQLLRDMGVEKIYDVSLGADICIWAHLKYIESNPGKTIITQPCPSIVSYIEKHKTGLLPYLSPVQSPMACLAIYMKKYLGTDSHVAAISPCIAKTNEHDATGEIEYNVTFEKLAAYLEEHDHILPEKESGFDGEDSGLGSLFPAPGGLLENIRFFTGNKLRIDRAEGANAYRMLDEYADTNQNVLPDIFDVLNCEGGCASGAGCIAGQNVFEVSGRVDQVRKHKTSKISAEKHHKMLASFEQKLILEDYLRVYTKTKNTTPVICEDDIEKSFRLLGKDDYIKQNFNCGACGSKTCREMARRIALGVDIPISCIVKSRDDAKKEHERNEKYLALVHDIAENLLSSGDKENYEQIVVGTLKELYEKLGGEMDATTLWQYTPGAEDDVLKRLYAWFGGSDVLSNGIRGEWPTEWIESLKHGEAVFRYIDELPPDEAILFPDHLQAIVMVPMIMRGGLWGFIVMSNRRRYRITDEDIAVVASCGLLIVSSIIEHALSDNLRAARRDAMSANAAKSNFLFSMSHEMRTPLNAIIGMTNIAKDSENIEKLRHCFDTIDRSSKHLLGLINDILDMSKIEAGKLEVDYEPFDLADMLIGLERILSVRAEEKSIDLRFDTDDKLRQYYTGDKLRLSQVITNLIGNAVKFTPECGKVLLTVTVVPLSDESGEKAAGKERIRFEVRDTGIGISEEQIKRLFNPFVQADVGITKKFGGTGLGLSISKGLIEKMGGFIDVQSEQGKGSMFFFEIEFEVPTQESVAESLGLAEKAAKPEGEQQAYDFSGVKALLVEDMEINREIVITLLDGTGLSIDEAENGAEALELYKAAPDKYDLIIMDVQMPVMDGYTATKKIRESGLSGAKTIPIIAMTANVFKEDIEEGIAAGMDAHLPKPIDSEELLKLLKAYSGRNE